MGKVFQNFGKKCRIITIFSAKGPSVRPLKAGWDSREFTERSLTWPQHLLEEVGIENEQNLVIDIQ